MNRRNFLNMAGAAVAMSAVSKVALARLPEIVSADKADTQPLLIPNTGRL